MKILLTVAPCPFESLTDPYRGGGAERAIRTLGEELVRCGHTVYFLTKDNGPERTAVINGMSIFLVPNRMGGRTNRSLLDRLVGLTLFSFAAWLASLGKQGHFLTGILNRIRQIAISKSHASWLYKNKVTKIVEEHGIELIHTFASFPDALVCSIVGEELHVPVVLRMGGRAWNPDEFNVGSGRVALKNFRRRNYINLLRYAFESVDCLAYNSPALKKHDVEQFQKFKIRPTADQTVLDIGIREPTELNEAPDPVTDLKTSDIQAKWVACCLERSLLALDDLLAELRTGQSDRLILSFAARFIEGLKHHDLLVRAIKLLGDEVPVILVFAGDGPHRVEVERLVRTEGVREHVIFLGSLSHGQVFRLLRESDIVLHPSEFEGSSKSIAEAMICGKPVIVSDIPANREHIQDGVTGMLSENSAQSFADKIRELASRPALRERIGNNARAYATHEFDSRRNVAMYEELFRTLVTRSKKPE